MVQIPQRPVLHHVVHKAKSAVSQVKPPLASVAIQAVKDRAKAAMSRVHGGKLSGNPLFQEYLEALMSGTPQGEALKGQLISRAREECARRRRESTALLEMLRPFQSLHAQSKFKQEVIRPARMRSVSSQACLASLAPFLDVSPKTPLLDWIESKFGPLTFGLGGGAEAGAGAGIEGGMGIAVRRMNPVAVTQAITVALGAYAEASASIQASVSGGNPKAGDSLTMDVSLSAAEGLSVETLVSLAPTLHKPTLAPAKDKDYAARIFGGDPNKEKDWSAKLLGEDVYSGIVVDYSFAGLSVSLGTGAGLGAAIGFTFTSAFLLPGIAK